MAFLGAILSNAKPAPGDLTAGTYTEVTGVGAQSQALNMNSFKISNLAAPTLDGDAARKVDVDAVAAGLKWKSSVRVATAAALPAVTYANGTAGVGATLTASAVGVLTVDGVATVLNDRILVKDQAAGLQNGIYKVTTEGTVGVAFILTRGINEDEAAEQPSQAAFTEEGTANADSGWTQTVNAPITMGTTALSFTQFTGLGQITAGAGLTKTANTLDVGAGTGITVAADSVAVDQAFAPTWTGIHRFTEATSPIVVAKIGPATTQQHVLPAVASDTIALLSATQTLAGKTLNGVTIQDATNIVLGTTTGTQLGTAATQKLGFWGTAPVIRSSGWTVTNSVSDKIYDANATTIDEIADVLGTLINDLKTYGFIAA